LNGAASFSSPQQLLLDIMDMRPMISVGTIATATALTFGSSTTGIIERMADADAFSFNLSGAGSVTIDVNPAAPSALDAMLGVYASDGSLLALADASANNQHLVVTLPSGS
jgi:hypothetical protein